MSDTSTSMMEQLDRGIDDLLACADGIVPACDPAIRQLMELATELRTLPRADFKAQLRADLLGTMVSNPNTAADANPIVRARPIASRRRTVDTEIPADLLPTLTGSNPSLFPVQRSSFMASLGAHALMIALLVTSGIWAASRGEKPVITSTLVTDLSSYVLRSAPDRTGGGGGGGASDKMPASNGTPPRFAREQIAPPAIIVRSEPPKLPAEPTVVGPPELTLSQTRQIGDPLSRISGPSSNGPGDNGGIGNGKQGGVGPGNGPGVGDGWGGGIGGGPYVVGHGVIAPRLIYDPEPEYSDEARKQKYQGSVLLQIVVGEDGRARDVRVAQSLGLGLDEKAIEAVRQWRFEPGRLGGRAVAVVVNIQVNFRLY